LIYYQDVIRFIKDKKTRCPINARAMANRWRFLRKLVPLSPTNVSYPGQSLNEVMGGRFFAALTTVPTAIRNAEAIFS
jgi:hypothetical protein